MQETVEYWDRVATLPPGPELAVALAQVPLAAVPNVHRLAIVQARSRQLAHDQAQLLDGVLLLGRSDPLDERGDATIGQSSFTYPWAVSEVAAGLTWTPTTAGKELGFAERLIDHLPLVFAALWEGRIDRGKAWVFTDYLDPTELNPAQIAAICAFLVPKASDLTTQQLAGRLSRAVLAIDPALRRRRYERDLRERGVALYLNPHNGTATLAAHGLTPDEAAAAAERLDRLARTARRAGVPGTLGQISADLHIGMLNGRFAGMTEAHIIDALKTDAEKILEGVEVRVSLPTLMGRDERPGEIAGLGPIDAQLARETVQRHQHGASWMFAIIDHTGHLLHGDSLKARPARRSDLDHTEDYAHGGETVEENLGPLCHRHHPDKDRGWTVTQPEPGHFTWRSPLGQTYDTRGEPLRHELPDPLPADHDDELEPGTSIDAEILWRPDTPRQRPPPGPPADPDEPPPF